MRAVSDSGHVARYPYLAIKVYNRRPANCDPRHGRGRRIIRLAPLILCALDGRQSARLRALQGACKGVGFDVKLPETIHSEVWLTFVRLTAVSGRVAVARAPLGVLRDAPDLWAMVQAAIMDTM